jgi:hypothetical protein
VTNELDRRQCLGGVRNFQIERCRAGRQRGDRRVDDVEIDDEQRRAVDSREPIGRDAAEEQIPSGVTCLPGRKTLVPGWKRR